MSQIPNVGISSLGAPFQVGMVVNHAFDVFRRAIGQFLVLSLIPLLPVFLLPLLGFGARDAPGAALAIGSLVILLVTIIGGTVANATTLYGAFQEMRGDGFTIAESLKIGLARFVPVIGIALLAGLGTGLGAILLLVPGLILMCMWYVAIPACIVEKLGVMDSLGRSRSLTKGFRWQIFALFAVLIAGSIVGSLVVGFVAGILGGGILGSLLSFGWQVLTGAFGAVMSAIAYHDLRVAKEGIDVSKLARVFD